jgi:hypothetical protein
LLDTPTDILLDTLTELILLDTPTVLILLDTPTVLILLDTPTELIFHDIPTEKILLDTWTEQIFLDTTELILLNISRGKGKQEDNLPVYLQAIRLNRTPVHHTPACACHVRDLRDTGPFCTQQFNFLQNYSCILSSEILARYSLHIHHINLEPSSKRHRKMALFLSPPAEMRVWFWWDFQRELSLRNLSFPVCFVNVSYPPSDHSRYNDQSPPGASYHSLCQPHLTYPYFHPNHPPDHSLQTHSPASTLWTVQLHNAYSDRRNVLNSCLTEYDATQHKPTILLRMAHFHST